MHPAPPRDGRSARRPPPRPWWLSFRAVDLCRRRGMFRSEGGDLAVESGISGAQGGVGLAQKRNPLGTALGIAVEISQGEAGGIQGRREIARQHGDAFTESGLGARGARGGEARLGPAVTETIESPGFGFDPALASSRARARLSRSALSSRAADSVRSVASRSALAVVPVAASISASGAWGRMAASLAAVSASVRRGINVR